MKFKTKQKIKKLKTKKKAIIGVASFVLFGLICLLVGFEIEQKGHAIRNWLSSPYASTFFISIVVILILLAFVVGVLTTIKEND